MFTSTHPLPQIFKIGLLMLENRPYGSVKQIARRYGISRSSCYNYMNWATHVLDNLPLLKQPKSVNLSVSKEQFILRQYLIHGSSVKTICSEVRYNGMGISKGEVSASLHKYGSLLPAFDTLPEGSICCIAIDETFDGKVPYLVTIDTRTGYILSIVKATDRKADTWTFYLEQILSGNIAEGLSISADFAKQIQSCLSGLEIVFHGDLFHYFRILGKQLIGLWSKFAKLFGRVEEAHKTVAKAQKMLQEQIVPASTHHKAVKKAQEGLEQAYQQATLAMQHYNDAQYLLSESKRAFEYFDNNGTWIDHQQAQEHLQTICQLGKEIPHTDWQKAIASFEKYIPAATQYIADVATQFSQLTQQPADQSEPTDFLWRVVSLIYKHRRKANCCKQYAHQRYQQQQANEWQQLLTQQIGEQKAQEMIAQLSLVLDKANRSSSMVETVNSRLKPYLKDARGQISQERINLIRFYLNHQIYERSRIAERKGRSPYQLFYQKQTDKRDWHTILIEDYVNKVA